MDGLLIRAVRNLDVDSVGELAGSRDRAEVRLRAAERGEEDMLVSVAEGEVVGVVSIRWQAACDPPHPSLYGLAVAALARRRRIGRALVDACEGTSLARGAEAVSLDVDADNAASPHRTPPGRAAQRDEAGDRTGEGPPSPRRGETSPSQAP